MFSELRVIFKGTDFIKLTEKLRVPDLNAVCTDRCVDAALECIIGCESDVNCVSGCLRGEAECIQSKSLKILKWILDFLTYFRLPM